MSDVIEVLFGADENYVPPLAVALVSLLTNNRRHRFRIHVVLDRELPEAQAKLSAMVQLFGNAELRFVPLQRTAFEELPAFRHFSHAIYLRLLAAELLPEVDRVLYLDCDLVVCADIGALWQVDLGACPVAGAPDMFMERQADAYVNSGVLLLDLDRWRAEGAGAACLRYISKHDAQLTYPDQDAINAVFAGRIHILPLRWNWQARMAEAGAVALGLTRQEFQYIRRNPGIVHYTTGSKPWMYRKEVHYAGLYRRYLALTGWNSAPMDKTLRRRISKAMRLMPLRRRLRWLRAG